MRHGAGRETRSGRRPYRWLSAALGIAMALLARAGTAQAAGFPPVVRGARAVLLRPDPGPLTIRITKRDLNIYDGPDTLAAKLYDPRRRLVGTLELPDDGNTGKGLATETQSGELKLTCETPGVYRLVIACNHDLVFGLETSSKGVMIEGDILLNDGNVSGRLCFAPPEGAFEVTAQALHEPGIQKMPLLDAKGTALHTFDLAKPAADQSFSVPAEAGARDGLWHLDLKAMDVRIRVSNVTHWTFDAAAYFDPAPLRWMLLPYNEARYLKPGQSAELQYTLRNRTDRPTAFRVEATGRDGLACRVIEPASPVALEKGEARTIRVAVRVPATAKPGSVLEGVVSATASHDAEVAQSAGIEVRIGDSPVSRPLKLPVVHERYRHENALFGYAPDYVPNEVYFDRQNRPVIRQRTESAYLTNALTLLEGERWVERSFVPALQKAYPGYRGIYFGGGFLGAKVAFDGENGAYTIVSVMTADRKRQSVLLYTPDGGRTYTTHELPGNQFDIEQFTGHNALSIPPPVLAYRQTASRPEPFASVNDLLLYLPKKVNGKLVLGEPVLVSNRCLGSCQHSGGPASTATRDGKTHIVWGEVTDEKVPGVPTYVATYDHATGKLSEKVLLAYAPPINDVHNVPAICMDSQGYLHVVAGAHGEPFQYLRSLRPNDSSAWTKPVEVLSAGYITDKTDADGSGRQTYVSLVCGPDDTLHIAYRQWRRGVEPYHGGETYAALSVQSKPKDGPWGPARPLVVPPVPGYSIYYHKLTIDRRGWLYLSYNHWTSDQSYQNEFPERHHHRAVLVSKDDGKSWKLAETRDFLEGIARR
ncbi:MAG: hypothetical protein GX785_03705 [Armatimonadetes bacterium]|nr:hypothetical protein [Armatimonadota bacterium]